MPKGEKMTTLTIRLPESLRDEINTISEEIKRHPEKFPDLAYAGVISKGAVLRYALYHFAKQARKELDKK